MKCEEENDENMNTKKPPAIDHQVGLKEVKNEQLEEDITSNEFTAKKKGKSRFEDEYVRKSSRTSKPKQMKKESKTQKKVEKDQGVVEEKPKSKKPRTKEKEVEDDDFNIIESLVDQRDGEYLVKWLNRSSDQNTWEPKSSIPKFILKFYEQDPSRLGKSSRSIINMLQM